MATFKRKCFYLSGFDPRGAPFYHRSYTEQAAKRPGIAVGKRRNLGEGLAAWDVRNEVEDVETTYTCLRWEDLVSRAWIRDPGKLVAKGLATYWRYLTRSDWPRVLALPRDPLTTLYYPLAAMVLVPLLIALVVGVLAGLLLPWWAALALGLLAGGLLAIPVLVRMRALWLVRLYVFNDALARGRPIAGLDARLDLFADAIEAAVRAGDADEVLLITHSNGSILAMPLMERLLDRFGGTMPVGFAVVTLAQCIPLVALRRDAEAYRAQIRRVAAGRFRWFDIGFPPDGACYALVDPFALGRPEAQAAELELSSPRFFLFHEKGPYEALRKQKYELHFEYLREQPIPSPLGHIAMTAGRRTVAEALAAFRALP